MTGPCTECGKPFEWWQRVTPGPRHGACNPEVLQAERERMLRPAGPVQAELDFGGAA